MRRLRPSARQRGGQLVAVLCVASGAAAAIMLGGCQKPLFPEETPRTQFELHDRMRSRYRPTEEPDVFGRPRPALRARLGRESA